jgi:polysaccharide deacetylase family protein (PEP-CTERM system associated)
LSRPELRNAISVDVEDYFHVSAFAREIKRSDWDGMEFRADASTGRLLDLFAELDVSATFFFLGWVAQRTPELVRKVRDAGHEVACHGMTHELIYRQTPETFYAETRDSKSLLEDISGDRVHGYRAASWSITRDSLWALDVLGELGFTYDSSIFPIRHDRYGIPGAARRPGTVKSPAGRDIVEFPPSTVSVLGTPLPISGGGYFRLLPYAVTRWGLAKINTAERQPFMFYLHPWEVDPDQPRIKTRFVSRFRHYTNLNKTHARLRRLLTEFRCTTVRNVLGDLGLATI